MKALNYLKSLLPNFAKSTVLEDVRLTKLVLVTITEPSYSDAMRLFGSRKFANNDLKADWENFKPMQTTLDLIETLIERDYNEDIAGAGVTYYKAAVLQMLESVSFAADYAMKYLNYVLVLETAELDDAEDISTADELASALVPAELRFIKERFIDFCTVMNTLSRPTATIKTDFESIPDINITEAGDAVVRGNIGAAKLDPFMHSLIPIQLNPIYHVRMRMAEWQNERHQQAKAEKDVLELRKLRMERMIQGKKDPALEQQIAYTQKRIDDLRASIRKTEAMYA